MPSPRIGTMQEIVEPPEDLALNLLPEPRSHLLLDEMSLFWHPTVYVSELDEYISVLHSREDIKFR